jgi:hypothetical protein
MKTLSLLIILIASANVAHANRCMDNTSYRNIECDYKYKRIQAFKALKAAENGIDDAKANLTIVANTARDFGISLKSATVNFNKVLATVGGSGETKQARAIYKNILNSMGHGYSLSELTNEFINMNRAENGSDDAITNFNLVMNVAYNYDIELSEVVSVFNRILRFSGGAGETKQARKVFSMLAQNLNEHSLYSLVDNFEDINRAENGIDDAIGNFQIILAAAEVCDSLEIATEDFIDMLREVGGAGETKQARSLYTQIYEL